MAIERRAAAEVRTGSGRSLIGYAAIFNVETRVGAFDEVIRAGAFKRSIGSGSDILMLSDHDPTKVLARTKAGTLKLSEDAKGLHFETADLPNTGAANDILELVRTGNAGGASFAFSVAPGGERWQRQLRELTEVRLHEISAVGAFPAYSQTEIAARSRSMPWRLCQAQRYLETC
jgi:HK97 family phage prohead protease